MHSVSLTTNLHVLCCNWPLHQSLKRWMTPFKQWKFLFIQQMCKFYYSSQFTVYYAQWSKNHTPLAAVNQMVPLYSCPQLCQKLTDVQNSFTTRPGNNSVTKMLLKIPPCLKCVTIIHSEIFYTFIWQQRPSAWFFAPASIHNVKTPMYENIQM